MPVWGALPLRAHRLGPAVMDIGRRKYRRSPPGAGIVVLPEEGPAEAGGRVHVREAAGEAGVMLVRPEASEGGASLTRVRLSERATPRSARSWTVHLPVMGDPQTECRVRVPGGTSCLRQVSRMNWLASGEFSRSATSTRSRTS